MNEILLMQLKRLAQEQNFAKNFLSGGETRYILKILFMFVIFQTIFFLQFLKETCVNKYKFSEKVRFDY